MQFTLSPWRAIMEWPCLSTHQFLIMPILRSQFQLTNCAPCQCFTFYMVPTYQKMLIGGNFLSYQWLPLSFQVTGAFVMLWSASMLAASLVGRNRRWRQSLYYIGMSLSFLVLIEVLRRQWWLLHWENMCHRMAILVFTSFPWCQNYVN